jgi:hypothetical protein
MKKITYIAMMNIEVIAVHNCIIKASSYLTILDKFIQNIHAFYR